MTITLPKTPTKKNGATSKKGGMTLVEFAYEEVKSRILNNEFTSGFQILENELAEELGISRTPLREAMKRLESEGLVQVIPRRGIRVVPLSPDDMREIYEVLISLESTAAELLAKRKPSDKEIKPMEDAMKTMEAALKENDLDAWAKADDLYHKTLLDLCGNARLASLVASMHDQSHRARMFSLRLRPLPVKSNEEHRQLLEAIKQGDADKARKIHDEHRSRTSVMITDILAKYGLTTL